jgi:hypothetical protein
MEKSLESLVQKSGQEILALWAANCAARVLEYFEIKFPEDAGPRDAIAAARAWARAELSAAEALGAAHAARESVRSGVNETTAEAAALAASYAARVADGSDNAIRAADYAVKAVREASLLDPKKAADQERAWQYGHLRAFHS